MSRDETAELPDEPRTDAGQPRRHPARFLVWPAVVGLIGLLMFVYNYLAVLARGESIPALIPLVQELTGAFVAGLLFFPIGRLVRRLPLTARTWPRRLPVYLAALLACGATATTLMWALRSALFPLVGLGAYDYGVMPLRYFMELPMQAIWFAVVVGALHALAAMEAARQRELRAARIESSLARAQLRNLRLQLQPHFLFNALHTISAAMYDDPAAADEMIDQLAELLRASLRTAQSDEVPLREEIALLDRYIAIQRARFGDRLDLAVTVEPSVESCRVPSLLLQPLVENAIRHGSAEHTGRGTVAVRARHDHGHLLLEVENDAGPAAVGTPSSATLAPAVPAGLAAIGTSKLAEPPTVGAAHSAAFGTLAAPAVPLVPTVPTVPATPTLPLVLTIPTVPVAPALPFVPTIPTVPATPTVLRAAVPAGPATDGAGTGASRRPGQGLGLAATAERLLLLYGDEQTFSAGPLPGGGFLVRARLPLRLAAPGASGVQAESPLRASGAAPARAPA